MRERMPLPKKIQNAPQLRLGLDLYYNAFWDLTSCRAVGWGLGPIPWVSIKDYGETFEFDEDQTESLFYFVRMMDNAFLDHHRTKETKN